MPLFVLCVPLYWLPTHPTDQKNCVIEQCPRCKVDMWVSEKKRALREADEDALVLCGMCVFAVAEEMGMNPKDIPLLDINNTH